MSDETAPAISPRASVRLDTLVGLRWLAVAGQAVAIVIVQFALDFPLPFVACAGLIGLSALVNIAARWRYPASHRLQPAGAFAYLAFDILQLAALLYLTGGLENPFSLLLMVPLMVSATTLPPGPTVALGAIIVLVSSGLAMFHLPLPWWPGEPFRVPLFYAAGVWVSLVSAVAFTGVYVFRVAEEARRLARALNETERVLAHEHHLYALDGLAAAAAHELGTPLATIALVVKEMERDLPADSPLAEDIDLLRSQSQRCRDILSRLTSLSSQSDDHLARLPLNHLAEEVVEPYRAFAVDIVVEPPVGDGPQPVGRRNPAIVQGLVNLVENAVDFADSKVTVSTAWTDSDVTITIRDDGPGFAAGILERIGEPYLTTRGGGTEAAEPGGLGLGFFIAKTLLERSGATLRLANRQAPEGGASVTVTWPRARMDTSDPASAGKPSLGQAPWREAGKSL